MDSLTIGGVLAIVALIVLMVVAFATVEVEHRRQKP